MVTFKLECERTWDLVRTTKYGDSKGRRFPPGLKHERNKINIAGANPDLADAPKPSQTKMMNSPPPDRVAHSHSVDYPQSPAARGIRSGNVWIAKDLRTFQEKEISYDSSVLFCSYDSVPSRAPVPSGPV